MHGTHKVDVHHIILQIIVDFQARRRSTVSVGACSRCVRTDTVLWSANDARPFFPLPNYYSRTLRVRGGKNKDTRDTRDTRHEGHETRGTPRPTKPWLELCVVAFAHGTEPGSTGRRRQQPRIQGSTANSQQHEQHQQSIPAPSSLSGLSPLPGCLAVWLSLAVWRSGGAHRTPVRGAMCP